jgi:conjugative transfer region protein TrbK
MKHIRLISYVIFGAVMLHAAMQAAAQQPADPGQPSPAVTDPLARELLRCKALNEKAEADARCRAAYEENRKRFFAPDKPYEATPVDMFPKGHNEPWTIERRKSEAPSSEK